MASAFMPIMDDVMGLMEQAMPNPIGTADAEETVEIGRFKEKHAQARGRRGRARADHEQHPKHAAAQAGGARRHGPGRHVVEEGGDGPGEQVVQAGAM
eukprot:2291755-Prymnesium_polylepis.3